MFDEHYGRNRVEVRVPLTPEGSDIPYGWYSVWVHPDNVKDLWSKIDRSMASDVFEVGEDRKLRCANPRKAGV